MYLFCELFGHWPTPLATRRRQGWKVNRCWLCEHSIVHSDDRWQDNPEAPPARFAVATQHVGRLKSAIIAQPGASALPQR